MMQSTVLLPHSSAEVEVHHVEEYEDIIKGSDSIPCPTCHGSGRVPKDHAVVESQVSQEDLVENGQDTKQLLSKISKEVFARIRKELKEMKVTQEVFAAVSCGRGQSLLSDLLRRGEAGDMPEKRSTIQNLLTIQNFLDKPYTERLRLYQEYKMESKDKRRLFREYYEETKEPTFRKKRVVSAHAKAVMTKFFKEVSQDPDKTSIHSISKVLNLEPEMVARFFERVRKQQKDGVEENIFGLMECDEAGILEMENSDTVHGGKSGVIQTQSESSGIGSGENSRTLRPENFGTAKCNSSGFEHDGGSGGNRGTFPTEGTQDGSSTMVFSMAGENNVSVPVSESLVQNVVKQESMM